jgi:MazG family protein
MGEPNRSTGAAFEALVELIARLRAPGGCPWDREQTHASLKPMLIEEAYEVLQSIDEGDDAELAGELGDILLQVVFHSQIAAEQRRFDIREVIDHVSAKMVRRHPHVFGGEKAETPGAVLRNWEALKADEQRARGKGGESMLESVPVSLPAVMESFQMTTKAARVGFDWPDASAVLDKVEEEARELRAALGGARDERAVAEEIGDLLFAVVNLARLAGTDPESALKAANRKFRRRFAYVEARLRERGRTPAESTLAEMDELWEAAKRDEKAR